MKTPKEIFDNRYLYYRDMLRKPAIPLEARQLIFDVMEEYHKSQLKNLGVIGDVSICQRCKGDKKLMVGDGTGGLKVILCDEC